MGMLFATERRMRCQATLARDLASSTSDPRRRREHLRLADWFERQVRDPSDAYLL